MLKGTPIAQMSSCFLLTMQEDSIVGIFNTLKQCALISKHAGGIGLAISNVRAKAGNYLGRGKSIIHKNKKQEQSSLRKLQIIECDCVLV